MYELKDLGFSPGMIQELKKHGTPGRISGQAHGIYKALTEEGEVSCRLPGRMLKELSSGDFPVTGDFIAVSQNGLIQRIQERKNFMTRGDTFSPSLTEVLVANTDFIFVVMSLNQDFNATKLRLFLIAAESSGSDTVLILTKADLNEPEVNESFLEEARRITDVPILMTRMDEPESVKPVLELLKGGQTAALLGASGVGKSTLINLLLGRDHLKTSGIRRSDDQGRHTTSHREILVMEGIGCLIDTPGMRRIHLQNEGDAVDEVFKELTEIMSNCRYSNCSHTGEPGCAVALALESGRIEKSDMKDYQNMLTEARDFERKARARERSLKKKTRDQKKPRQKVWHLDDQ